MKERLNELANKLTDLAAEYEERVAPKSWVDDGWKELIKHLAEYDSDELVWPDDANPTEVVHELFLRLQEAEGRKRKSKELSYFGWNAIPEVAQAVPDPAPRPWREVLNNVHLHQAEMQQQRAQMQNERAMGELRVNPFLEGPQAFGLGVDNGDGIEEL